MPVQIVTDSTSSLPPNLAAQLGVTVVPAHVSFGTESYREGVDLGADEFYRLLQTSPHHPTTSQPNPAEFEQAYRQIEGAGDIVSIHLSTDLSKTVESARQAAAQVSERRVEVLDSRLVSAPMALCVIAAARAAQAGAGPDEIREIVERHAAQAHLVLLVPTLEYLKRGGRIGGAQAFVGSLLSFKPILELNDGLLAPVTRVRTMRKAYAALAKRVQERAPNGVASWGIVHANAPAERDRVRQEIADGLGAEGETLDDLLLGPALGAHAGPGAFGFGFVARS